MQLIWKHLIFAKQFKIDIGHCAWNTPRIIRGIHLTSFVWDNKKKKKTVLLDVAVPNSQNLQRTASNTITKFNALVLKLSNYGIEICRGDTNCHFCRSSFKSCTPKHSFSWSFETHNERYSKIGFCKCMHFCETSSILNSLRCLAKVNISTFTVVRPS